MEKLMTLMVVAAALVLTKVKVQGDQDNSPKDVRKRLQGSVFKRCTEVSLPCEDDSECCAPYLCKCTMGSTCDSRCRST
uniref:Conotoxin n=1 Tax=Conus betulinus TaxID=89764 RepID=A0A142C1B6_CONBE|nr:conotoxin [Conus betulinus]